MKADTNSNKAQQAANTAKKKVGEVATQTKRTARQVRSESQSLGRELNKSGRKAYDNAQQFAGSMHDVHRQLSQALQHQASTRPYLAVGAAAAVGFVLAGGLTVRLTSKLAGIGGRMLLSAAMKNLFDPPSA